MWWISAAIVTAVLMIHQAAVNYRDHSFRMHQIWFKVLFVTENTFPISGCKNNDYRASTELAETLMVREDRIAIS